MGSLLNVGTRALQANQVALQTAGNNIANVNVPGYSRQKVVLATVPGQFSSSGYVGQGVNVQSIERNFSEFLTRQATLASSTQYADTARADKLRQLEGIFAGGTQGLGAAISDMLNAFSDVASAPTDMTARTVVLTRIDETAARFRSSALQLDDLETGVAQELSEKVTTINSLASSIAAVNDEIIRSQGNDQPPNDLLDRRDQLIKELNRYVQTTSVKADDGSLGIYIGGSQELVLGNVASSVKIVKDDFGDSRSSKLAVTRAGTPLILDESLLGGGEVSGLLRFQNNDLNEGRNLLGRLTLATTTAMNDQHKLGLDLDGNVGGDLFSPTVFGNNNVMIPKAPATLNTGGATLTLSVADTTKFAATDYEIQFTGATTGTITRRSDSMVTAFDTAASATNSISIDGLDIAQAGGAAAGDRFLIKPFSTAAGNVTSVFSTPRALAVASPVAATMGAANTGSLQQVSIMARSNPLAAPSLGVVLTFTGSNSYTRSDQGATVYTYTPGEAIEATVTGPPLADWSLTLQGTPKAGDTVTVNTNLYPTLSAGNAVAMMDLRDMAMFDGAALTDGFAGLISQVGIRTQSADYAAKVSTSIATNVERDRAGVAGVNLDEEAASLLQYQQAYQASAKMIQIAQNIFDTLIQNLSR
ncbi:MAG: flagellar hook-associated protein FlgK [Rhodoferax sp.]|nr:flagellar hook-associated protein FlgK [Rhodoferax sp.]